ncbi:MAG: hypothetical protein JWR69_3246 [Pedosphaera sp.]|nr:hypothetical protein [Pedosphaera sp.]
MFLGYTTTFIKPIKIMKQALTSLFLAAALGSFSCFAQMGSGATPGMDAAMTKLFGKNNAFTAKAELNLRMSEQKEPMTMEMNISMLEGKTRSEMDMTTAKGGPMPPNAAAMMKQMGMDKIVAISRPDKKMTLVIYPGLQSYAEIAMSEKEAASANKDYKLETASLGKETIDGHPCEKNKVTMTDDKGEKQDALVWNASDLKDFPVQLQMTTEGNTILMKFKEVKLDKPAAKLFDAPTDLTKYTSLQTMMQEAMMKKMGGAGGVK